MHCNKVLSGYSEAQQWPRWRLGTDSVKGVFRQSAKQMITSHHLVCLLSLCLFTPRLNRLFSHRCSSPVHVYLCSALLMTRIQILLPLISVRTPSVGKAPERSRSLTRFLISHRRTLRPLHGLLRSSEVHFVFRLNTQ